MTNDFARRNGFSSSPGSEAPELVEDEKLISIISGLAKIQCTIDEAAAVLGTDAERLTAFLDRHPKSFAAWCSGPAIGRVSLRRMQFQAAQKGNARMLIWLGKQWLGQSDAEPVPADESRKGQSEKQSWEQLAPWRMQSLDR